MRHGTIAEAFTSPFEIATRPTTLAEAAPEQQPLLLVGAMAAAMAALGVILSRDANPVTKEEEHRIAEERRREIVRLHQEGLTGGEIAVRLGVTPALVRMRLREIGLPLIPAERIRVAEQRRVKVQELHYAGYSPKEIAARVGISLYTVYPILRDAELVPRIEPEAARAAVTQRGHIISLARQDYPRHMIAQRTGVPWSLVTKVMESAGVEPVLSASDDLIQQAASLLRPPSVFEQILEAKPDTEPAVAKVDWLQSTLVAMSEAAAYELSKMRRPLPRELEREMWRLAFIHDQTRRALEDLNEARRCLHEMDVARLPQHVTRAEDCVKRVAALTEMRLRAMTL